MIKLTDTTNNMYATVNQLNYTWIDELNTYINSVIDKYDAMLHEEAELDKNCEMTDIEHMYKCFKRNVEFEETFAQYEVLKYFRLHMIIKCLNYVVGKWTFTEEDKEMLEALTNLQRTNKCAPRKIRVKSCKDKFEQIFDANIIRTKFRLRFYDCSIYSFHRLPAENFTDAPYLFTFLHWMSLMLKMTNGADTTSTVNDFFNYKFDPMAEIHGEYKLVSEEQDCNCFSYKINYAAEQAKNTFKNVKNGLFFKVIEQYTEEDASPFNVKNKLILAAANILKK